MIIKKKLMFAIAALAASKHSVAGAIAAGVAGAGLATTMGFDPWTWLIGAVGGVIVRVKLPPTTRADSIMNGVISVMLAGLAAPWFVAIAMFQNIPAPSVYFVAFMLAVAWPWLISLWPVLKSKLEKWGNS